MKQVVLSQHLHIMQYLWTVAEVVWVRHGKHVWFWAELVGCDAIHISLGQNIAKFKI